MMPRVIHVSGIQIELIQIEEFSELEPNKVDIPSYDSNTQYGCLLGAYASQSSMTVNGSSMNLGWYSFPHPWAVAPSATPSPTS